MIVWLGLALALHATPQEPPTPAGPAALALPTFEQLLSGNFDAATVVARRSPGKTMKATLGEYDPDRIPGGVGPRNRVASDLATDWTRTRQGSRVLYQPIIAYSGGGEGEWIKTQLLGGIAPEVIQQNAEVAWTAVGKQWYVPLEKFLELPNPYIPGNKRWLDAFKLPDLVLSKRAPDGHLYTLTIDMVETAFFYNKDLLRREGLPLPRPDWTWEEMLATFKALKARGYVPLATPPMALASDWGQDIVMEMLYHAIIPQMDPIPCPPDTIEYQQHFFEPPEAGFLVTKGFYTSRDPRWREVHRFMHEWRQYWSREQKNTDNQRLFLTERAPFLWDITGLVRRFSLDKLVTFDWGVAYVPRIMPGTGPGQSVYATGSPATLIGGAGMQLHVSNSAVLNGTLGDVIDYLMFISAPQNMGRLSRECMFFSPNVKGVELDPRMQRFDEIFSRRPCVMQFLENLDGEPKRYWRRMLDYWINDGFSRNPEENLRQYLPLLDRNFERWIAGHRATGQWVFTPMEAHWREVAPQLDRELDPAAPAAPGVAP